MPEGGKRRSARETGDAARPHTAFVGCADSRADRAGVRRFAGDLRDYLELHMGASAEPSVMLGVGLPPGKPWRDELILTCRTAKAFLPLLSPGFLTSRWCAREWAIFAARVQRATVAGASPPSCILVVDWVPPQGDIPRAVRALQSLEWSLTKDEVLESAYRAHGLYYLMRHHHDGYHQICEALARWVVVAAHDDLAPLPAEEVAGLEPAFAVPHAPGPEPRQVAPDSYDPGPLRLADTRQVVAGILADVPTFQDAQAWRTFVRDIVRRRGRTILHSPTWHGPAREQALIDHLSTHHGDETACTYIAAALETVPDSVSQRQQVVAIRDRLRNDPGNDR